MSEHEERTIPRRRVKVIVRPRRTPWWEHMLRLVPVAWSMFQLWLSHRH